MSKSLFVCKPDSASTRNSKLCEKAYKLAASMQSARDFCEEYIAAHIWPLRKGWSIVRFHEKTVRGKAYIFPDNEVSRPKKFDSDEESVSAVETKAADILGKFLKTEKDAMDKVLGVDYKRLNRVFEVANIKYGERPPPAYSHGAKPSIENVVSKKRGGAPLKKAAAKKKKGAKPSTSVGFEEIDDDFVQQVLD